MAWIRGPSVPSLPSAVWRTVPDLRPSSQHHAKMMMQPCGAWGHARTGRLTHRVSLIYCAQWPPRRSPPLAIVALLSHGERCVCELQDALAAAQSRLSFHLKTLKDAGLVTDRREGRWVYYALNREVLDEIAAFTKAVKPGKHAGSCARACCT